MRLLHRLTDYAWHSIKRGWAGWLSALGCAVAVAVMLATSSNVTQAANEVIARAGSIEVTAEDVRTHIATLKPEERATVEADLALLSQVVRTIISREAVLAEATARKWGQQPEVKAQLERVRQDVLIQSYLQSVSEPPEDFPSDGDLQSAYNANKSAFLVPRQFRLAQIYIAAPKADDQVGQAQNKLDDVLKRLARENADFAAIAQATSDAQTNAGQGGDVGWLLETQIRPEIREVVTGMAEGTVSQPLRLDDGWHIVKLLDTKAAYTRPLSEVRPQLTARLRAERAVTLRRAYIAKLLDEKNAAINEFALSKLLNTPGH